MKCETKWKKRLKQGMISIPDNSGTNIDVGKKISGLFLSANFGDKNRLIVMDYAFGEQAIESY
jgi:hypothetical protein